MCSSLVKSKAVAEAMYRRLKWTDCCADEPEAINRREEFKHIREQERACNQAESSSSSV